MNFHREGHEEHEDFDKNSPILRVLRAFVVKSIFRFSETLHNLHVSPTTIAITLTLIIGATTPVGLKALAQDKKLPSITVGYSAISGSFAPLWAAHDQGLLPSM